MMDTMLEALNSLICADVPFGNYSLTMLEFSSTMLSMPYLYCSNPCTVFCNDGIRFLSTNISVTLPLALVAFSAFTLCGRKGIWPVKKWGMVEVDTG